MPGPLTPGGGEPKVKIWDWMAYQVERAWLGLKAKSFKVWRQDRYPK